MAIRRVAIAAAWLIFDHYLLKIVKNQASSFKNSIRSLMKLSGGFCLYLRALSSTSLKTRTTLVPSAADTK